MGGELIIRPIIYQSVTAVDHRKIIAYRSIGAQCSTSNGIGDKHPCTSALRAFNFSEILIYEHLVL